MATISSSNITITHLRVLVAVVEEGSFTAAAQKLGLTQSAISQALRVLEDTLAAPLLLRGRGRIEPTQIGHSVLAQARQALSAIQRIHEYSAEWAGLGRGALRIGSIVSAASKILPAHLRSFRTRYPKIDVSLIEGSDEEVCEWVSGGAIDIGFTTQTAPNLAAEIIATDNYVLASDGKDVNDLVPTAAIAAISQRPFIMSGSGCEPAIQAMFAQERCAPNIAFRVRDMGTLLEMVRQGLGLTIIPEFSIPPDHNGLRFHRLEAACRREILMVTNTRSTLSPAVQTFATLVKSGLETVQQGVYPPRVSPTEDQPIPAGR